MTGFAVSLVILAVGAAVIVPIAIMMWRDLKAHEQADKHDLERYGETAEQWLRRHEKW